MFTGIVQQQGRLTGRRGSRFVIDAKPRPTRRGESVAVNGVCLTVAKIARMGKKLRLGFDLTGETLNRTTFQHLPIGSPVNLEWALTLTGVLGGHIVQGHVDGRGRVHRIIRDQASSLIWFEAPGAVRPYLVPKGSVTVDGVSLTVAALRKKLFSAALIPETLGKTTLGLLKEGEFVNLEADIIAKYVAKYAKRVP